MVGLLLGTAHGLSQSVAPESSWRGVTQLRRPALPGEPPASLQEVATHPETEGEGKAHSLVTGSLQFIRGDHRGKPNTGVARMRPPHSFTHAGYDECNEQGGKKQKWGDSGTSQRGWVLMQFPAGNWEGRRGRKEAN